MSRQDLDARRMQLEHLSREDLLARVEQLQEQLAHGQTPAGATGAEHAEKAARLTAFAIDNAAEAMFTVAADGRILDVNKTTCRRLEYTAPRA